MRVLLLIALLLAVNGLPGAPAPSDEEQLRSLISMPQLHFNFGMVVTTREGLTLIGDEPDVPAEILAVKADLKGDLSDAPRYQRLGWLCHKAGDDPGASNAWLKAAALWRKRLDAQPENSAVARHLGEALHSSDQTTEADAMLRQAVKLDPKDWEAWVSLGNFLNVRAVATVGQHLKGRKAIFDMLPLVGQNRPPAAQIEEAQRLLDEAVICLDKAVQAAPSEGRAWFARAQFASLAGLTRLSLRVARGEEVKPDALISAFAPVSAVSDVRRAIELLPDDHRVVTVAVLYELFHLASQRGLSSFEGVMDRSFFRSLNDSDQKALRDKVRLLEDIGRSSNPTNAAAALERLGTIQWVFMSDPTGGEATLRRAIDLNPRREAAWDALMALIAMKERAAEDFVALAEKRLKSNASLRNQVILAKACEQNAAPDKALQAAQKAVEMDRKSVLAQHTLAVLLIRKARDRDGLLKARAPLLAAVQFADDTLPADDAVRLLVNAACYNGIIGDLNPANDLIAKALEINPKDQDAKQAKAILQRLKPNP